MSYIMSTRLSSSHTRPRVHNRIALSRCGDTDTEKGPGARLSVSRTRLFTNLVREVVFTVRAQQRVSRISRTGPRSHPAPRSMLLLPVSSLSLSGGDTRVSLPGAVRLNDSRFARESVIANITWEYPREQGATVRVLPNPGKITA